MSEPKNTQEEPVAVLIVPQDDSFNSVIAEFVRHCSMLRLSTHADAAGDMVKAVAW